MGKAIGGILAQMSNYFGKDVKRINHALKVYGFAKSIGELEGISDDKLYILEIAAVLHDIGIKESERKYNSSAAHYQELEGPPVARELLESYKLDNNILDRVCYLIGSHHSYNKIDDVDFQVLVEADFLVNIHEDTWDKQQVRSIREKYFKTKAGLQYLDNMYLQCG